MPTVEGLVFDYNQTLIRGYHEIPLAYALLSKAIRAGNLWRSVELGIPLQLRCWKLALNGDYDALLDIFSRDVLKKEDNVYLDRFAREFDPDGSWLARQAQRLPKM